MRSVRPATTDDLAAVTALDAALFPDEPWDLPAWQGLLDTAGRRLLVAADDADRPVGYALTGLVGDFAELLRIAADPTVRRRGVATALLARACAEARSNGAERLLLEVGEANTGARALYAAAGFVEIDRRPRYYRDGSAALVLERALAFDTHTSGRMDP
ncbi:GNAT family N-acetyltransferase [Nocardioides sp. Y6]|uniref:GNAT family N-acetyltransferase n=1 Tax=Nocardioides malaquae TaxID=2773426 RepID=A0ABR9RTJ5_9ACTN|nr:GNAT family N-acetyltransferase [Nocardioides malaquae]MBE7324923.1 GNAT family N-acetyltransferase [Nocardioides malaquae]